MPAKRGSRRGDHESRAVSSVEKALGVLEIAGAEGQTDLATFAAATGLPKPTLMRLIGVLVETGFLERTSRGRYSVTLKLWRIGCSVVQYDFVRQRIVPLLGDLMRQTGETTHYAVYELGHSVYVEKVDGTYPIRSYTEIGGRSPAFASATGKALLAWRSPEEIEAVAATVVRFTPTTLAATELADELQSVRRAGVAVNHGEWREGVWGVAAPVMGRSGTVAAAVGVSGPQERIQQSVTSLAELVRETARQVSLLYGADEPAIGHPIRRRSPAGRALRQHDDLEAPDGDRTAGAFVGNAVDESRVSGR